jgi:hypothetical protein
MNKTKHTMRVINEVFAKQLIHKGDRTISSGIYSSFTAKAMLSGEEQISIGGCRYNKASKVLQLTFSYIEGENAEQQ